MISMLFVTMTNCFSQFSTHTYLAMKLYRITIFVYNQRVQKPLCCNKIECGWTISFVYKHRKARGMRNCYENLENDCIVFDSTAFEVSKQIVMKSLRISCRSDKYIPATNYVGIILYAFKKEGIWTSDWVLNGKHCKTGYILIKQERNLHKIMQESAAGITRHMALFKWFFNELPNENTLGAGFSIQKKDSPKSGKKLDISKEIDGFEVDYDHYKLYVNSRSFNTANSAKNKNDLSSDVFHDNKKYMHQLEQKWIAIAVDRWKSGRIRCKEDGIIQINAENDCCDNCKRKILQTQF